MAFDQALAAWVKAHKPIRTFKQALAFYIASDADDPNLPHDRKRPFDELLLAHAKTARDWYVVCTYVESEPARTQALAKLDALR